jgi:hypothetical protein
MLTLVMHEKMNTKNARYETQIAEFTICTAMIKDRVFARIAFGALDDSGAKERSEKLAHFLLKNPTGKAFIANGFSDCEIYADNGKHICTMRDVNIMMRRRVFSGKVHWFFEIEGLYRDVIWID